MYIGRQHECPVSITRGKILRKCVATINKNQKMNRGSLSGLETLKDLNSKNKKPFSNKTAFNSREKKVAEKPKSKADQKSKSLTPQKNCISSYFLASPSSNKRSNSDDSLLEYQSISKKVRIEDNQLCSVINLDDDSDEEKTNEKEEIVIENVLLKEKEITLVETKENAQTEIGSEEISSSNFVLVIDDDLIDESNSERKEIYYSSMTTENSLTKRIIEPKLISHENSEESNSNANEYNLPGNNNNEYKKFSFALQNFSLIVRTVEKKESHLFHEEEKKVFHQFFEVPQESQILFVRLFYRKVLFVYHC